MSSQRAFVGAIIASCMACVLVLGTSCFPLSPLYTCRPPPFECTPLDTPELTVNVTRSADELPLHVFGWACADTATDGALLAAEYEVIVYVWTDQWYIQPLVSDFRHSLCPNGYFDTRAQDGGAVHVFLAQAGRDWLPSTPMLPPVDGDRVIAEWYSDASPPPPDPCAGTDCDDGNVCTHDECDSVTGECVYTNNSAGCDDGDVCTEQDRCADGECTGTPIECGEGVDCVDGACIRVHCPTGADCILAGYEPVESIDLTVSRDNIKDRTLTITWPVLGGHAGVPPATQGDHVLGLEWTGETDGKVEIRHDWAYFRFDLARYRELRADVYVETDSALPGIAGIWDDVFGWTPGYPVPTNTNEWVTISMDVGHLVNTNLDHVFAFLFDYLAAHDGLIYVDNLRLAE